MWKLLRKGTELVEQLQKSKAAKLRLVALISQADLLIAKQCILYFQSGHVCPRCIQAFHGLIVGRLFGRILFEPHSQFPLS